MSRRWLLLPVVVFLAGFQIRYSVETLRAIRELMFVPFRVRPFTNRIDLFRGGGVRSNVELLAVNGRPFTGLSVYLQELRTTWRRGDRPLSVTVRSSGGPARTIDAVSAHCTCGVRDHWERIRFSVLSPAFCVLLGVVVAFLRPGSPLGWAFLALMLSLSQLTLLPEEVESAKGVELFRQAVDLREWPDWFRVPSVAYTAFFAASWPAWLLLFAAYRFPPRTRTSVHWAWLLALPVLGFAILQSVLAVCWSEYYRAVTPLYRALEHISTELIVGAFLGTILFAARFGKRWTAAAAVTAALAVTALYWPASPPTSGEWLHYSDKTWRFEPVIPRFLRTTEIIGAAFASAVSLLIAAANYRALRRVEVFALVLLALLLPFLFCALAHSWRLWKPEIANSAQVLAFLGLTGMAWAVVRRLRADG